MNGTAGDCEVLHIDTGNVPTGCSDLISDLPDTVNQYGAAFSFTFHGAQR